MPISEKMSVLVEEMSHIVLLDPEGDFSLAAGQAAILLSHLAWNESVGLEVRKVGRKMLAAIEAENPDFWSELVSRDVDAMLDALIQYKEALHPEDQRRIVLCSAAHGKLRVEWLDAADPGVDSQAEVELHGLIRIGLFDEAIKRLQSTGGLSRKAATAQVALLTAESLHASPFPSPDKPRSMHRKSKSRRK